jgi:2'-5' RNA ligase
MSGLVVEVPEAEAVVASHRLRLDPHAALGVPAHVTLLFPFVKPDDVDAALTERLRSLIAEIPAFTYDLVGTRWFGDEVLWLAPDQGATFRLLTQILFEAFPDFPPYEGRFDDVVPHLTIGDRGPLTDMRRAESAVRQELPMSCRADEVTLLVENESGRWSRAERFPLGGVG